MLWLKCLDLGPTGRTHITHGRGHCWASGHKWPSECLKSGLPSSLSLADYLEKQESAGLWSQALRAPLSGAQRFQRNKSPLHWQLGNPGTPSQFIDVVGIGKRLRDWSSNNCWLGVPSGLSPRAWIRHNCGARNSTDHGLWWSKKAVKAETYI